MTVKPATRALDGAAIGLSGACLAHCLALPLVAVVLPALAVWQHEEWTHIAFVLLAAPLSGLALLRKVNGRRAAPSLMTLAGVGLVLLAAGAFGPPAWDVPLTVGGSLALAGAHLANWRRSEGCGVAESAAVSVGNRGSAR